MQSSAVSIGDSLVCAETETCEDLPEYEVPPAWLFTPRSYLLDRYTPMCEQVFLPKMTVQGGKLAFLKECEVEFASSASGRIGRFKKRLLPTRRRYEDGILLDLRYHAPENWAHFLTNHLPLTFKLAEMTGTQPSQLKIILPEKIPPHIPAVAAIFGLQVVCTDDTVKGEGIAFSLSPWTGARSIRHSWVQAPWVQERLAAEMERGRGERELPKHVFIVRRDTRRLKNEHEVADHLEGYGFAKIYMEDLSLIDQFRVFNEAEEIVGIHGAGLAPLLYRNNRTRPLSIIELFPVGHVTFVWRVLAHQARADWTGVRGHLSAQHIGHLYDLANPLLKFSLEDFTVDIASIDHALRRPGCSQDTDTLRHAI